MKAKNPRLSHRFFAKKLGVSSGALSEILKGKRKISDKLAQKIAERLNMDPRTRDKFLNPRENSPSGEIYDFLQIEDDQFHLISEWWHYAILNLVKSDHCQHKISWFAERLELPEKTVSEALNRMLRLGMLTFQKKKYVRKQSNYKTSDNILNLSIRKSNLEDMELLRDHLATLPVEERDLTSITMLLKPEQMQEFKKWIRAAQDRFASKFETTDSSTAYRLTVGLFPLKKPKS
jgi:uncharacterized protein (TIGR02147 family)